MHLLLTQSNNELFMRALKPSIQLRTHITKLTVQKRSYLLNSYILFVSVDSENYNRFKSYK